MTHQVLSFMQDLCSILLQGPFSECPINAKPVETLNNLCTEAIGGRERYLMKNDANLFAHIGIVRYVSISSKLSMPRFPGLPWALHKVTLSRA